MAIINQATKELQRRFAGYSPRGQKLLAGRLAATRELFERAPSERYALELFWTDNTDLSVDDVRRKVAYDLEYIRRQSALEDLKIMLRTVPVMLLRRGGR